MSEELFKEVNAAGGWMPYTRALSARLAEAEREIATLKDALCETYWMVGDLRKGDGPVDIQSFDHVVCRLQETYRGPFLWAQTAKKRAESNGPAVRG